MCRRGLPALASEFGAIATEGHARDRAAPTTAGDYQSHVTATAIPILVILGNNLPRVQEWERLKFVTVTMAR